MPVWYRELEKLRRSGDVKIVGLIQEQHADRCALFLQWKQMDFPVLVDSLNRTGVPAVPMLWVIDGSGVVRKTRPDIKWFRDEFVKTDYPTVDSDTSEAHAESAPETNVGSFLAQHWNAAIDGWRSELERNPSDARIWFRWACACRARYDHGGAVSDFQNSVTGWSKALQLQPNNYIFRRRVEQYGPRMKKPYPFYNWVEQARKDIRARGEKPLPLIAEPRGAELALPSRTFEPEQASVSEPDPDGKIARDVSFVRIETVVSPNPVVAGETVRISVLLTPNADQDVHWTNDAGTVTLVVTSNDAKIDHAIQQFDLPQNSSETSHEVRQFDFEVLLPKGNVPLSLKAYVVYHVCTGAEGQCVYRRQDLTIELPYDR